MNPDRLFSRWRRRFRRLLKRQETLRRQSQDDGGVDAVHDLRVAIRRLRLFVRLAAPFVGREASASYEAWSRGLSQATSALRDHDVVLEWLSAREDAASLTTRLRSARDRLWRAGRRRLHRLPAPLRRRLTSFRTTERTRRRFSARYAKRFERLLGRVRPRVGRYAQMPVAERHAFRRGLRQLRYLRELAVPERKHSRDDLLSRLVRPQVAMGERQNLELVRDLLGRTLLRKEYALLRCDLAEQIRRQEQETRAGLEALDAWLRD